MTRPALFALLAGAAAGAFAAPVPKDTQTEERLLKLYGTRADEKKRGTFSLGGDRLTIALAAHVDEPFDPRKPPSQKPTPLDATRITREISGDFVACVGITCPRPPTPPDLVPAQMGGGIGVVLGEGHYFTAERHHVLRYDFNAKLVWDGSFDSTVRRLNPAASRSCYSSHRGSIGPLQVRLTRRGDKFTAEASADGKKWEELQSVAVNAPEKLRVGLFAHHNTKEAADIVFVGYTVTRPE